MAECATPGEGTLLEITCTCDGLAEPPINGMLMERYLDGAPAVGKIAGMSPQQRRGVLLQRSRDHFQKEVKHVKHEKTVDFLKKGREKAGL
jgi:hypothetical protein